jgi:hypothetical protein
MNEPPKPANDQPQIVAVTLPDEIVPAATNAPETEYNRSKRVGLGAMRAWLESALTAAGATKRGASFGGDSADLDIELDGNRWVVEVRRLR